MRNRSLANPRRWGVAVVAIGVALGLTACGSSSSSSSSKADNYPVRTIQVIVPYPAGSSIDTTTRALVDIVNKQNKLGKRLQVVNKQGGAGSVGTTAILSSKPDGYTIGVLPDGPLTLVPHTEKVSYDPKKISVIGELTISPIMFAVPGNSKYKKLSDVIADAKANPDKVTFADGPLNYTVPAKMFESLTGVKVKHVKFDGDQATTTALLGNNVDVGVMQLAGALPQLKSGKLRALGIATAEPVDLAPDIPTFDSQGVNLEWQAFNVIVGPDNLPSNVMKKLTAAIDAAMQSNEFKSSATKLGLLVSDADGPTAKKKLDDKFDSAEKILAANQ